MSAATMSRHAPTSRNNEEANVFRHQFSTMSWSARSSPVQLHEACIFSKCFAVAMESVFVVKHGECLGGKTKGCLYLDSDLASLYPDSQSSKHMRHMCTYVLDVEVYVYMHVCTGIFGC